jgi:hypothetical protein
MIPNPVYRYYEAEDAATGRNSNAGTSKAYLNAPRNLESGKQNFANMFSKY